jgi:hypothetical protein
VAITWALAERTTSPGNVGVAGPVAFHMPTIETTLGPETTVVRSDPLVVHSGAVFFVKFTKRWGAANWAMRKLWVTTNI